MFLLVARNPAVHPSVLRSDAVYVVFLGRVPIPPLADRPPVVDNLSNQSADAALDKRHGAAIVIGDAKYAKNGRLVD